MIFGERDITKQYLLGGTGNDFIKGNNKSGTSKLWGGDGDDTIDFGGRATVEQNVWGGKGDDRIGARTHFDEVDQEWQMTAFYDDDFIAVAAESGDFAGTGRRLNEVENLYGEQGDDIIVGGTDVKTTQNIHGGSGDDRVYAGAENAGVTFLYGNSG